MPKVTETPDLTLFVGRNQLYVSGVNFAKDTRVVISNSNDCKTLSASE